MLSQAGIPARALTRNLQKAQKLPGITWVAGDLAKPETLATAFEGVKTVFLLTHYFEDMVALQRNAIAAARAAGVTHVVKVSAFAASDHSRAPIGRWHYQVEKELQASGLGWTMIRPHHFMQNLLAQAEYIVKDGAIYSPSGDGKIPYVDARDVAAVAFVTLTQPGHRRQEICGDGKRSDVLSASGGDHRRASSARSCGLSMSLQRTRGRAAFAKACRPPSSKAFSRSAPISARAEKPSRSPIPSLISLAGRREPSPNSPANMQPLSAVDCDGTRLNVRWANELARTKSLNAEGRLR